MTRPDSATVLLGLISAGVIGMSLGGLLHWWLVDPPRQSKLQRFVRRWIASFLAYFVGLMVLTLVAGPRAMSTIPRRFSRLDEYPSNEPLTWGVALAISLFVSLLAAASSTFGRKLFGYSDDGARDT